MTGAPKSYRALLLAAMHARHPSLDGVDKMLLTCLATNAHGATGEGSRPGNAAIADAIGLKWSATHRRIEKVIKLGLVERTSVGDGRHNASVYRLVLENAAFPDATPGGEKLIAEAKQSGVDDIVSETKPSRLDDIVASETVRPTADGFQPDEPKPYGLEPKPYGLDRTTSKPQLKKEKRKKAAAPPFALPDWIPGETWKHFEEMRLKIRRPLTDGARHLAVQKLQHLRDAGADPSEVLEQSILNAWAGLFPVKPGTARGDAHIHVGSGPSANGVRINPAALERIRERMAREADMSRPPGTAAPR